MDILTSMLGSSQSKELLATLTGSGFSAEQAKTFLPAAGESIVQATAGLDLSGDYSGGLIDTLLRRVDIQGLASQLGMDSATVTNGLTALLPQAVKLLQGGGLPSLASGGGIGGLLDGLTGKK